MASSYYVTQRVTAGNSSSGGTTGVSVNSTRVETGTDTTVETGSGDVVKAENTVGSEGGTITETRGTKQSTNEVVTSTGTNTRNVTSNREANNSTQRNLLTQNNQQRKNTSKADIAIMIRFAVRFDPNRVPFPPKEEEPSNPFTS